MAFMGGAQQLFPSTCFSLNTSPLLAPVPKQRGLSRRMECSFVAHRRPQETIDANLLMTLLWRLLKHQQRGRKHLLRGGSCSIAPNLDSTAVQYQWGKKRCWCDWAVLREVPLFWGAITIMMISLVAHRLICWLLLTPARKSTSTQTPTVTKVAVTTEMVTLARMLFWWGGVASLPPASLTPGCSARKGFWIPARLEHKWHKTIKIFLNPFLPILMLTLLVCILNWMGSINQVLSVFYYHCPLWYYFGLLVHQ